MSFWDAAGMPMFDSMMGMNGYDCNMTGSMWFPKWGMFGKNRHFMASGTPPPFYYVDPQLRLTDASDGTTNVILLSEKRVPITGLGSTQPGDERGYTCGFELDTIRTGGFAPASDRNLAVTYVDGFGSSHTTGFNVAYCDGSVRFVRFDVDLTIFQRLCHRADGTTIDWAQVE
jgi:prepilin-type processing-associated H-X9-DG protein